MARRAASVSSRRCFCGCSAGNRVSVQRMCGTLTMRLTVSHNVQCPSYDELGAARAIAFPVAHRNRDDRSLLRDGGLQQRAVKFQQPAAIGGRAFREYRDELAALEGRAYLAVDARRVVPARAADVQRAGTRGQPAGERPARDFGLGDETRRHHRVDRKDIDPRDVIRHQHRTSRMSAVRGGGARDVQLDREYREQLTRPAAYVRPPLVVVDVRKNDARDQHAADEMQDEPRDAQHAHRQRRQRLAHRRACGSRPV